MSEIIKLHKLLGETPLECIERFRSERPEYKEAKMTYLGRLDPMADGLLLVLAHNTKDKEKYLILDKTYEFEVLWGFRSDTYDILGLVEMGESPVNLESKLTSLLKKIKSKTTQEYPLFSSKVFGKDFLRARDSGVEMLERPERGIKIFDITHIHTRSVTGREIVEEVERKIGLVRGDFRQEEILKCWKNVLMAKPNEFFLISKFRADVSSGTYIRGLAEEMGKILKTGALAYGIKRTRVGDFKLAANSF